MGDGINWQRWGYATIRDLAERAHENGANYVSCVCPRCGRLRLEVDAERNRVTCEKCRWKTSVKLDDEPG